MVFNKGFDLKIYVRGLPVGLERSVLRVLMYHVGAGQAVSRKKLVADVQMYEPEASDRGVRAMVNQLRKDGFPICSTGGVGGGYFLAACQEELDGYLEREVMARIADFQEQASALKRTRKLLWGEGTQGRLF